MMTMTCDQCGKMYGDKENQQAKITIFKHRGREEGISSLPRDSALFQGDLCPECAEKLIKAIGEAIPNLKIEIK